MRVLHLSDLHVYLSGPRAKECRRIIDWIALHAIDTKPNFIIIAGDIFERRSSPQERIYLAEFLAALCNVAFVFIISGNHDDRDDLRLFRKEYGWNLPVEIILEPRIIGCPGVSLAFLPWPSLGNLAAKAGSSESIVTRREMARSALIDVLRGFRGALDPSKPSLLIAHVSVTGASMDSGQPVSGGEEIALTVDELLESGAAGVALGHIHLRQQMRSGDGRPVWYAGAPFRTTFGEASGTKGGLLWDWIDGAWRITSWDFPAKNMLLLEGAWTEDKFHVASHGDVAGAEVRLRVFFQPDEREAATKAAEEAKVQLLEAGAESVLIDERPALISRTRCAEIEKARTTIEKLNAWAQAAGSEIPEDTEAKLRILEVGAAS
jgi:DNA repair exonuclease SbcCD nuclease subunit